MSKISFSTYLFQPFRYIAGGKSLLYGLCVLLLLALLSYWSNTYFDGVLDIHSGSTDHRDPFLVYAGCVFGSWLIAALIFYLTALILAGKSVRWIDMAGTLALAKAPVILAALLGFVPDIHYPSNPNLLDIPELMNFMRENVFWILIMSVVFTIVTIWSVVWMYKAYSVSGNLKSTKGIVSFIVALFISEIIAKIGLILLL
jgi:hypothetical protein